jgi:hypothetical protein
LGLEHLLSSATDVERGIGISVPHPAASLTLEQSMAQDLRSLLLRSWALVVHHKKFFTPGIFIGTGVAHAARFELVDQKHFEAVLAEQFTEAFPLRGFFEFHLVFLLPVAMLLVLSLKQTYILCV